MNDCHFPWEVPSPNAGALLSDVDETPEQAGARHGVKASKIGKKARALGLLPRLSKPGTLARLPTSAWDRVAALCIAERKPTGPRPGLAERRTPAGCESLPAAAHRLGVDSDALRQRAARAGRRYTDGITAEEWTAMAAKMRRAV